MRTDALSKTYDFSEIYFRYSLLSNIILFNMDMKELVYSTGKLGEYILSIENNREMKFKGISTAIFSTILLLLFFPVFYCIIFLGNNMNYLEQHKIETIEGNKVLLLCVVIVLVFLLLLYALLRKIPYNRFAISGTIIITFIVCIVFYIFNENISKCIAFYGGWDCGMVANSARWVYEGGDIGYGDYYTIYSNNIPITWLLYKLYSVSSGIASYPYNSEFIWIQFQCGMLSLAVFFSVMTVLMVCKKMAPVILTLIINCIFLGISPWKIIPYTDGASIAIPIFMIFLYTLYLQLKGKWRYLLWLLLAFVGIWGGILKATCYITLIAIVIIDLGWTLFEHKEIISKVKTILLKVILFICGYMIASYCKFGMYETLQYEYDYDMEIGWSNYFFNGLNEETTGTCSGEGLEIVRNYAGEPRSMRTAYELECIKERIANRGFRGMLDFWLRKQVMNYNDGTFSWYQEGYFNAWAYEDIIESRWKVPLRSFYWEDGEDYLTFTTLSQGIWIFVLVGVIVEAFMVLLNSVLFLKRGNNAEERSNGMCIRTVGILTFIGVFLFVMLFEGRARYLYNTIPVFSTMALIGYCELADMLCCLNWRWRKSKNGNQE